MKQRAMANQGGNFLSKRSGFRGGAMEDKDFDEEDVWGVVGATKEKGGSTSSSAWRVPATTPRKIPRANNALPLPSSSNAQVVHDQGSSSSSAPRDIPDWSKIYGKNCMKGLRDGVSNKGDCGEDVHDDDDGDGDGDDDDMIPPHEWIARKLARNQISSFSVCEGMGRTLKGRDLSKVRNAILTKTGFIE